MGAREEFWTDLAREQVAGEGDLGYDWADQPTEHELSVMDDEERRPYVAYDPENDPWA